MRIVRLAVWPLLAIAACGAPSPAPAQPPAAGAAGDARFIGTIESVQDLRPIDGSLSIVVAGNRVTLGGGSDASTSAFGRTEGLDLTDTSRNVGRKVEVFARRYSDKAYAITGAPSYYVKALP